MLLMGDVEQSELPLDGSDPDSDAKRLFSARLNALCDEADPPIPPKGKNRQTIVGKLFGVGQKGARKWLEGESLPTFEKAIKIATHFDVHVEWLWTGRGPKKVAETPPPDDVLALAKRILDMPEENRRLLVQLFQGSVVQDEDPRLGKWSAANKPVSRLTPGRRR